MRLAHQQCLRLRHAPACVGLHRQIIRHWRGAVFRAAAYPSTCSCSVVLLALVLLWYAYWASLLSNFRVGREYNKKPRGGYNNFIRFEASRQSIIIGMSKAAASSSRTRRPFLAEGRLFFASIRPLMFAGPYNTHRRSCPSAPKHAART